MMEWLLEPYITKYVLDPKKERVLVLDIQNSNFDLLSWAKENKLLLDQTVQKYGGVLIRNSNLNSVSEFNCFVQQLYPNLIEYVYRSTPRTKLGGKIYTATEYPADRSIPLHNEFSYATSWPDRIVFFSIITATEGGETPIADSSRVYQRIDPLISKAFEDKGILYVRHYRKGLDLSWQEVFQTTDKLIVENYCKSNNIEYEWKTGSVELVTRKISQANIFYAPINKKVWFNQAHLFHVSSLEEETRKLFIRELGEETLPRNSFYGDGSPIEVKTLDHIRFAYDQEKINFKWQRRDILILDNILMSHGREPFVGERKIAVAMATIIKPAV